MPVLLRDYQADFVQDVRIAMRIYRRVLGVAPTGSGKTVCFSHIAQNVSARGKSVLLVAHRIEIIRQISRALTRERVRHGFIAPKYPMNSAPVQVGMVMTVANRLAMLRKPDLFIVDEAHHAVSGSYMKIVQQWNDLFIFGVTATPCRLDGKGLRDVFDVIVEGPSMRELQDRGFLSRFTYYAPPVVANLANLRKVAGDFSRAEAEAAMNTRRVTGDALAHYAKYLNGKPTLGFCPTVNHAHNLAAEFRAAGWKAAAVDADTADADRDRMIASIGDGRLNLLFSCDVISEGTDVPSVAGVIDLSPTLSLTKYLQKIGRGLRPNADGSRTIILDHVGNVLRHGMPDAPREWTLDGTPPRPQAAAVKQCPQCYCAHHPARVCPACGHEYVAPVAPAAGGRRGVTKQVGGRLVQVAGIEPPRPVAKKALDKAQVQAARAGGKEALAAELALCRNRQDVVDMCKRRKYHRRWVDRVWPFVRQRLEAEERHQTAMNSLVA